MASVFRVRLLATALAGSAVFAATASFAQSTPTTPTGPAARPPVAAADDAAPEEIIVTGSLFKRNNLELTSPVTQLTTADLEQRGFQTVQAGIQSISANNGPALTNSFTANGAFAGGASAVSLRGLTTSSTLTLFDGLRASYYPLADDGTRNFVDLNTIPDEIVDRIEVLKDGASSLYGADAVAGVVNIITKKNVQGLLGNAEAGISERGDSGNHRVSLTYGYGDLSKQGFNVYISAHYIDSEELYNRQRGYPYNTADQSRITYNGVSGPNNIENGTNSDELFAFSTRPNVLLVRPANGTNTTALGPYQLLNPAAGCQGLTPYTLSDTQIANNPTAPRTVCQQDIVRDYNQIEPKQDRWGIAGRATVNVGGRSEAYAEFNYESSYSAYTGLATIIRTNAPAGINFQPYSTSQNIQIYGATTLALPVYVCPRGTTAACTAANGTLNPQNPFAAQGQVARLAGRLSTSTEFNSSLSDVYRIATGLKGTFGDDFNYTLDGTAMLSDLTTTAKGYVFIQHLLDVVNDGSFNFVNPAANSQATLDYLTPTSRLHSNSHLYQGQVSLSKRFFHLRGGQVEVAIGGAIRYEDLYDPSGNPDAAGPTQRYFRLNAFGATGHRYVESGYFEINAPILKQLEANISGRYDTYSSGQSKFSPKVGLIVRPVKQLSFRGTYSEGFRIPSFAESGALPTTGYVTQQLGQLPKSFVDQHLNNDQKPDAYLSNLTVGETTVGNPNLKAENSRSFTGGVIIKPVRDVSLKVDYYNIKKTGAIASVDFGTAINNYYKNGTLNSGGVTIIPDEPDPDHPNAQPRVLFARGSFINANSIETSGIDFQLDASHKFGNVTLSTHGEATLILNLDTSFPPTEDFPNGSTQHYVGTLGNFNLTAGSGTTRWNANWSNTIEVGKVALTATAYYVDGYNYSAEDQTGPGTAGQCGLAPTNLNGDQYQPCDVGSFVDVDLHGAFNVTKDFTLYADVINVADRRPPIDATTYGAYLYNPVVGDKGIVGRSFRVGVRAKF